MQIHQLRPVHKPKRKKRVGRGGKRGNYCGRGIKGQNARAGAKFKPIIRDLIKRYPKLRGYKFRLGKKPEVEIVNLNVLEKKFKENETICPASLVERKIIDKTGGKMPKVKILGKGKITKKLVIENCFLSKKAKEKIEKSGGEIR